MATTPTKTAVVSTNTPLDTRVIDGTVKIKLASFNLKMLNQLYRAYNKDGGLAGTKTFFGVYVCSRIDGIEADPSYDMIIKIEDTSEAFQMIQRRILKE